MFMNSKQGEIDIVSFLTIDICIYRVKMLCE
jgi:hypothetical protein